MNTATTAEEVADEGANLLRAHGLHALTPEYVARRLGRTVESVARAQPDFPSLAVEVFRRQVADELTEVRRQIEQYQDPDEQLAALVDLLADPVTDSTTSVWVEAFAMSRRNEQLAIVVRAEQDRWLAFLTEIVRRAARPGSLGAQQPRFLAAQLLAMIDGLNAHALARFGTGVSRRRLLEHAVTTGLGVATVAG